MEWSAWNIITGAYQFRTYEEAFLCEPLCFGMECIEYMY